MKKKDALHGVNVAFIGAGAMGTAMIGGVLSRPASDASKITASDRHQECLDTVRQQFGILNHRIMIEGVLKIIVTEILREILRLCD